MNRRLSLWLGVAFALGTSVVSAENAAQRAARLRNARLAQVPQETDSPAAGSETSAAIVVSDHVEEYRASYEAGLGNNWFQEFRLMQPRYHGPFRYTHPLIPRRTMVPGTNRRVWSEQPYHMRAEHARFGNGFSSIYSSHRRRW